MSDPVSRLEEIQEEMSVLLDEAQRLVRQNAKGNGYERAKAYWIGQIEMALSHNHSFLGRSMCTMTDTISEMDSGEDGECDDCGELSSECEC
jgi:hypothetical protein